MYPWIGRLTIGAIGSRRPEAAVFKSKDLKVRRCSTVCLIPFQKQRNAVLIGGSKRDSLNQAAGEALGVSESNPVIGARNRRPGGLVSVAGIVSGGRQIADAFRFHGLDRLRNDSVLEERLVEI